MSSQIKSPGTELNRLMDGMGLSKELGEMYGAALDRAINNDLCIAQSFLNTFSGLATKRPGEAFSYDRIPKAGYVSHPRDVLKEMIRLDKQHAQKQGWRN